ncbi:MAG: carbohydrate kinase family protein [Dehalococcoidia bacterium]|nr:carbohydrate kinase family protein [Dehalococcoidia bacterium]
MTQKQEITGLGAMNLDLLYSVDRVVTNGESTVTGYQKYPGGSAANTIYALARLGARAGFSGTVGDDDEGRLLVQSLRSAGVNTDSVAVKKGAATGTVLAVSDKSGHRALYVSPGANNLLTKTDVEMRYLNEASVVHFSSFTGEAQFQLQKQIVKKLSPKVMFSFAPGALYAYRGLQAVKPFLSRCNVLFLNSAELKQLTGEELENGAGTCLDLGCRTVVVTLGKSRKIPGIKGNAAAYIRDREMEYFIVPKKASDLKVVDTTGAGDAFCAGFLYGMLKGKGPYQCGLLGDLTARFSLARAGARDGLPGLAELTGEYRDVYKDNL